MAKKVNPLPKAHPNAVAYLNVPRGLEAIEWYRKNLGAKIAGKMATPDKKLMHSLLLFGNSAVMVSDMSPVGYPGTSSGVMLYVTDAKKTFDKAVKGGAKALMPCMDQFWGDRWGCVQDPFGQVWQIAQHIEDVDPKEMGKRMKAAMAGAAAR